MILRWLIVVLLSTFGTAQTAPGKYQQKFENDVVAVYEIDLPAQTSASAMESTHDNFWIALNAGSASFSLQQKKVDIEFQTGDTRFFPSFESKSVINTGSTELRTVVVGLKPRGLVTNGCECTGNTGKAICGCKGATHLEPLWAFSLGEVTLAGTSLSGGEAFRAATVRDDMLLVAITGFVLLDEANVQSELIRLKSGDAIWIKGGPHQFKNESEQPARFVTFEF